MKRCTKCGQEKPATTDYFYRRSSGSPALRPECIKCRVGYVAANAAAKPAAYAETRRRRMRTDWGKLLNRVACMRYRLRKERERRHG